MNKKRIGLNAFSAALQVVLAGLILFVVYRFLLKELGANLLGVWSLIMATTSVINLANFGLTSGLVKFVSEYITLNKQNDLYKLLFTSLASTIILLLIISSIIIWGGRYLLPLFIDKQNIDVALSILPYSVFCLNLNVIGGVFTSTLEGFQRNYLRHATYILGLISFLSLSLILVPTCSIYGVVYSQIIQSLLILSVSSYICVFKLKIRPISVFNLNGWDTKVFKKLFSFGSKFQVISASQMFLEPTVKILLSKFGGISIVAYYEMALRLISQLRSLIVSVNQILLPIVAEKNVIDRKGLKKIYSKTFKLIITIGTPILTLLFILSPLVSQVWIGEINKTFITFLYILIFSSLVVILNGPAYFGIVGEGRLNIMLVTYLLMVPINVILAYLFSVLFSREYGAVIGSSLVSIIVTGIMSFYYQRMHNIQFFEIIGKYELLLLFVSVLLCITSLISSSIWGTRLIVISVNILGSIVLFSPLVWLQISELDIRKLLFRK